MNGRNDDYICLVLGETGVGKSSFINTITQSNEKNANNNYCKTSPNANACTKKFQISRTSYAHNTYSFIETPELKDFDGDEKNINAIKTGLSDYPKFRCILVLMKFQDKRLTASTINSLKIFMQCFPTKDFWKHVFIVRTFADYKLRSFDDDKANIKGTVVKSFHETKFKELKTFMEDRNITIPTELDEFYVDNPKKFEGASNFDYNNNEIINIFNKIRNTPTMFKDVKKLDKEIMNDSGVFPTLQTWRTIIYICHGNDNKEITSSPFLTKEEEKCPYPVEDRIKEKVVVETESNCGDVSIKYDDYETCIYRVPDNSNGYKSVKGKRCYKGYHWE